MPPLLFIQMMSVIKISSAKKLNYPSLIARSGIGALTEGLARKLEERGGRIRIHTPVERIITENGRAVGVEVQDGERPRGDRRPPR